MLGILSLVFIAAGSVCGAIAAWHELRWGIRIRNWDRVTGIVVDTRIDDEMFTYSEIEFLFGDTPKRFFTQYSDENPALGSSVEVIFDPSTGRAERYCLSNRWVFTLGPGILAILFLWVGLSSKNQHAEENVDDQAAVAVASKF